MSRRVTLKDVARHAGVSNQTVSKVLRDEIKVTPDTRARIERTVTELGYQPNVTARNLRTQASQLIGCSWRPIVPSQINPILEQFLQSIVETAEASNYHVLLFPLHNRTEMLAAYHDLISTNRVDGLILSDLNYNDPRVAYLLELDSPLVQCFSPGLTSLHQPIKEVGETVVTLLTEIISGNELEKQQIVLAPKLIVRESSMGFNQVR